MRFVDISGYGHSGKGVVTDLLKEFDGFNVPHPNFEFNLLRIQGGLIDLWSGIVDNWSPIRSDAAIRRFRRLIERVGPKASLARPKSLFYSNGMNYDDVFNGQFSNLSNEYLDSLINDSFFGEWPYPLLDELPSKQFFQRLLRGFKLKKQFLTCVSLTSVDEYEFIELTHSYLRKLFASIQKPNDEVIVTHNALEPFNPDVGLKLFPDSKLLIVQRDPRDIYSSVVNVAGYIPGYEVSRHWEIKKAMLGIDNIDTFCQRQLIYYDQVRKLDHEHVLRLRYEDIVIDYDNVLERVYEFLGLDSSVHTKKHEFFNPEDSIKNIGLWKNIEYDENIKVIEERMPEYLFEH